jgi:outer membrane biosynthesis protein TonB
MRVAAGISAAIHLALIGVMYFGLPLSFDSATVVMPPVIEVEFVRLDEETKLTPPEPAKEPPPAPAIAKEEAPEPEPVPEPAEPEKTAEPEPEPQPVVEEPAPPEPMEQAVKPAPKPKEIKRPPPKPRLRPKLAKKLPSEPKKQRPKFDPNRLIAKLDKKLKERQRPAAVQPKADTAPVDQPRQAAVTTNIGSQMTISELDLIRAHIGRNWSPNWGAPGIERMVVRIRIFLRADGSLSKPPEIIEENAAGQSEQVFRPFADSALRAVLKSVPLPVPREKFNVWREIDFTFSLKEMLG